MGLCCRVALPRPPASPRSLSVPIQQPPSQPSGRVCPIAPSRCFPAGHWGSYCACPSLRRLTAGLGSSEGLGASIPAALCAAQSLYFPFPRRSLLWCDLLSWQLALTLHPSPDFCRLPGAAGATRANLPSYTTPVLCATGTRSSIQAGHQHRAPPGPSVGLTCQAGHPHVMQLAG